MGAQVRAIRFPPAPGSCVLCRDIRAQREEGKGHSTMAKTKPTNAELLAILTGDSPISSRDFDRALAVVVDLGKRELKDSSVGANTKMAQRSPLAMGAARPELYAMVTRGRMPSVAQFQRVLEEQRVALLQMRRKRDDLARELAEDVRAFVASSAKTPDAERASDSVDDEPAARPPSS